MKTNESVAELISECNSLKVRYHFLLVEFIETDSSYLNEKLEEFLKDYKDDYDFIYKLRKERKETLVQKELNELQRIMETTLQNICLVKIARCV